MIVIQLEVLAQDRDHYSKHGKATIESGLTDSCLELPSLSYFNMIL